MFKKCTSSFLLLSQSLSDEQTDLVIEVAVVYLLVLYHLPHLARVAPPSEVYKHHHPIHEQNEANAEDDNEVGLGSNPSHVGRPLDGGGQEVVGNPGVGSIEADRSHQNAEDKTERPKPCMGGQLKSNHKNH